MTNASIDTNAINEGNKTNDTIYSRLKKTSDGTRNANT